MTHKQNWTHIGEVRVRFAGGNVRIFDTLDHAVTAVGWTKISSCTGRRLGYTDPEYARYSWAAVFGGDPVVFSDELGLVIPIEIVRAAALRLGLHYYRPYARWFNRKSGKPNYTFRNGPVPGTCGSRTWGGYKGMRTQQEISAADFLNYDEEMIEYGITVRGSRNRRALPTYWDDVPSGRCPRQSWKRYRRHQWKE